MWIDFFVLLCRILKRFFTLKKKSYQDRVARDIGLFYRYILYVYLKQVIKDAIKQFTLNFERFFLF